MEKYIIDAVVALPILFVLSSLYLVLLDRPMLRLGSGLKSRKPPLELIAVKSWMARMSNMAERYDVLIPKAIIDNYSYVRMFTLAYAVSLMMANEFSVGEFNIIAMIAITVDVMYMRALKKYYETPRPSVSALNGIADESSNVYKFIVTSAKMRSIVLIELFALVAGVYSVCQ